MMMVPDLRFLMASLENESAERIGLVDPVSALLVFAVERSWRNWKGVRVCNTSMAKVVLQYGEALDSDSVALVGAWALSPNGPKRFLHMYLRYSRLHLLSNLIFWAYTSYLSPNIPNIQPKSGPAPPFLAHVVVFPITYFIFTFVCYLDWLEIQLD